MRIFFVLILLLLITVLGTRRRFKRKRKPLIPRYLILTGTEFILIGLLLGKSGLNILDEDTLYQLKPFLVFALGWVGFIFGIQFDRHQLSRLPSGYFSFSLLQGYITAVIMFCISMTAFRVFWPSIRLVETLIISLLIAGTAACSTQATPAIIARVLKLRPRNMFLLIRYVTAVDGIVGVLVIGLLFCFIPAQNPVFAWLQEPWKWLLVSVGLGITFGLIFKSLTFYRFSQEELLLILVGMTIFSGGIALFLHISPIFITFIMGLVVANLSRDSSRILEFLVKGEHLSYVCILLFAGASMKGGLLLPVAMGIGYFILRMGGKLVANYFTRYMIDVKHDVPNNLGLTLVAQGGMALALTVSLHHQYVTTATQFITTSIIIGIMASELTGPYLLVRILEKNRDKL